jgi:excisionase family DNA binding protein
MHVDKDRWYTEAEARDLLGIPQKTFSRRLNDGRLAFVKLGKKKRLIHGQAILDDLLAAQQKPKSEQEK